mmetsp:Transcript_42357/g.85198  ORF Transcript_42357/g.85198 Transcript_42357/m.85198 type:complete len:244 (-) Transcript_42357:93-824(-)
MRPNNELERVLVVEGFSDVLPESVPGPARGDAPAVSVVGVGPHKVADGALVRDLDEAVKLLHVLDPVEGGGEAAVGAEDGIVDDGGEWEEVEEVREVLPHVGRPVHAQALVVEPVHLCDLTALVVSAGEGDAVRVPNLECNEKEDAIQRVVSSVHVVAEEEIVVKRWSSSYLKQLEQVEELPMHIAHNDDGSLDSLDIVLSLQDCLRHVAQLANLSFWQDVSCCTSSFLQLKHVQDDLVQISR